MPPPPERSRCQGTLSVVRFNWPLYAAAGGLLAGSALVAILAPAGWARSLSLVVVAGCSWFLVGSIAVSHWVYDRSDLYRWNWLRRIVPRPPARIVVCHSGFDEVSPMIRTVFPGARIVVLDHYEESGMSEPSIRRARGIHPPRDGTLPVPAGAWPPLEADLVLGLLAIHELRSGAARSGWFREARRSLAPGGRVVLAEHVRDPANFAAFGPGFLHFHPVAGWRSSWEDAGLSLAESFRITPFVRVFVLHPR